MKKCIGCKLCKEDTDFYIRDGLPKGRCKACRVASAAIWRKANKEKDKGYKKERSNRLKQFVDSIKSSTPCTDCGKLFPAQCMEYDHLGDKKYSISRMITDGLSTDSIINEISKTELVCILCHRHRTYTRGTNKYSERRKKNVEMIWALKDHPCSICNAQYSPWQMDFDHVNPDDKLNNVAQMVSHSRKKILDEISKCKILCALCHRLKSCPTSYSAKT